MRSERVSHVHVEARQHSGAQWSSRVAGEIGKAVLGQLSIIERLQIAGIELPPGMFREL